MMNEENERERREIDGERVNLEVESVSKEEAMENMQRMKNGKAVGPDDIPVEVWKCLGESALKFLTKLYNRTMESERMPEEWRDSVLIPIFKNKGDVQSCSNYRGIKLISHTMKLWERIVEKRLRSDLKFSNQQYGFIPGKSTTDALFALRVLMEIEVQRRSEGATLCVSGPGEGLRQGAKRRGVVLHEKVWIGREVRENSTRYV